jgi:hypothetical protein
MIGRATPGMTAREISSPNKEVRAVFPRGQVCRFPKSNPDQLGLARLQRHLSRRITEQIFGKLFALAGLAFLYSLESAGFIHPHIDNRDAVSRSLATGIGQRQGSRPCPSFQDQAGRGNGNIAEAGLCVCRRSCGGSENCAKGTDYRQQDCAAE